MKLLMGKKFPAFSIEVTTGLEDTNKMQDQAADPFYYVGLTKSRTYDGVSIGRGSRTVRVVSCRPEPRRSGCDSYPLLEAAAATVTPGSSFRE